MKPSIPLLAPLPWGCLAAMLCAVGAAQAADTAAPPVEKVSVKAVAHFDFNRDRIRPEDEAKILAEVGQMKGVTWQTVATVGYTDSIGSPTYNEKLSERRARAVKAYLVGKGLDASMIKAEGKGEEAPVADNDSDAGRAQNRRTEIEFQGIRAK